ncbi:hypothetical protein ACJJTC_004159 [Scirpophaga incertulas]
MCLKNVECENLQQLSQVLIVGAQLNHEDSPDSVEEQVEILRSEQSSLTSSPVTVLHRQVHRESPLTTEQRLAIEELENLGFVGDDFDIPIYSNKSPLSVFTTNKDVELQELNISSIENQLTPLFTPIAPIDSIGSPNILETSTHTNPNTLKQTVIEDSDDSVADPNYQPENEESSPMSPILSSAQEKILPILHNSQDVKRSKRKKPENWIKNVRKNKRNIGETYTTNKGKIIQSKKCGTDDCKCLRACHTKVDTLTRQNIHLSFWTLGSIDRQRDFIVSNVLSSEATRSRVTNSRRKFTLNYSFKVDSQIFNVCQSFFLQTLNISDKMVRTALEKARRGAGNIPSPDKRGRHTPSNKLKTDSVKFANDHIDSFPKVPSHWCRKDTKKNYLESKLNKEKMYDLYKIHCLENNQNPIGKNFV